jgi:hypothetical protein
MGVTTCNFIMAGQSLEAEGTESMRASAIEYVDEDV